MAELITGLSVKGVRDQLARVQDTIASVGADPDAVAVLAAIKYVAVHELPVLAEAGVTLVGENRAQELVAKTEAHGHLFTWDFIGHLQSRKVRQVLPLVRYVHSVASDSALEQLGRHGAPDTRVLIEVNVAGEAGKSGIAPAELADFLDRCPVTVVGLMTMPPQATRPQDSRPHFAALGELAHGHGLRELSRGTSQDYAAAVQEGATIIRLGSTLYG
jgi:PLP dependent protein